MFVHCIGGFICGVCFDIVQSNLNNSNTVGSFTMANLNSFMGPYEILPIAQENRIFLLYNVCLGYSLESPH